MVAQEAGDVKLEPDGAATAEAEKRAQAPWDEAVGSLDACVTAYETGPETQISAPLDAVGSLSERRALDFGRLLKLMHGRPSYGTLVECTDRKSVV
jgi:hypothetical protein